MLVLINLLIFCPLQNHCWSYQCSSCSYRYHGNWSRIRNISGFFLDNGEPLVKWMKNVSEWFGLLSSCFDQMFKILERCWFDELFWHISQLSVITHTCPGPGCNLVHDHHRSLWTRIGPFPELGIVNIVEIINIIVSLNCHSLSWRRYCSSF